MGYFTDVKKDGSSSVVTTTVTLEDEGDDYSYKFVGLFEPTETATYNFKTRSDDGSWVFFNRELVVDNSGLHGPEDRTGSIDLVGGQSYEIIILYGESGATGELGFWWKGGSVVTDYTQTLGDYFSIFSGESAVVSYCSDCGSGATTASTGAMTIDECSCTEADLTFSRWNNGCSKTTATADVATAFQNASPGDFFLMTPGTLESGSSEQDCDPVCQVTRLLLKDKHVTFMCNIGPSSSEVCTWKGNKGEGESGSGMRVVRIENSGGTTALYLLTIREGDFGIQGGGMFIRNSKVLLYVVSFIDNYAGAMGGGLFVWSQNGETVVLKGCKFEGNTARDYPAQADMNDGSELTMVEPCPTVRFSSLSQITSTLALTVPSNFPNTPVWSYSCIPCSAGWGPALNPTEATPCSICPVGKSSTWGTECENCAVSKTSVAGSSTCTSCEAGKTSFQGECTSCTAGRYSPAAGSPCLACSSGKSSSAVGATSSTTCTDCVAGTWAGLEAAPTCTDCEPGKWSDSVAATAESISSDLAAPSIKAPSAETTRTVTAM